jgi:hypothetical protein
MAEKRKYNAGLNAKGLEDSVSEDQARHMAHHQGNTYMFIVQAHSGPKVVAEDGSEKASLIPDLVELVPAEHEERIRRFHRALYLNRPDQFGQAAFEEATPSDVPLEAAAADVDALVETDDKGEPTGIWTPDDEADRDSDPCPAPECDLPEGHDGDHQNLHGGNVVEFSGSGKASG